MSSIRRGNDATAVDGNWSATLVVLGLSWLAIIIIFRETSLSLFSVWMNSAIFAHGVLILPISAYVVWLRQPSIAKLIPTKTLWGLPILMFLAFSWLLGAVSGVALIEHLSLVGMLQVLTWTILGTEVSRALLFPLLYLFMAVPLGENLTAPLQDFTAVFVVKALELTGIPVLSEGTLITVSSGVWEVAEECSGVRYLIPAVALGCVYANLVYRRWSRRLAFVLVFSLVPVLGNGLRAFGVVILTHFSQRFSWTGALATLIETTFGHLVYGWVVFTLITFVLFRIGSRWRETDHEQSSGAEADRPLNRAFGLTGAALTAAAAILLVAAAPVANAALHNRTASIPGNAGVSAPEAETSWSELPFHNPNWQPRFAGVDEERAQSYRNGDRVVHLYLAHYANQERGELINSENTVVPDKWRLVAQSQAVAVVDGMQIQVNEITIQSSEGTHVVWSWYRIGGQLTGNPYYGKYLAAKALLFGGPRDASFFAVATDRGSEPDARTALQAFLSDTSFRSSSSKAAGADFPVTNRRQFALSQPNQ